MPQPSVVINDLSLSFGSVKVLEHLNLEINRGEFLVLLGPSGCGKSTLLNCVAGLLDITDGQIFIEGRNVTWEEPKDRGIGMVFQSYALYPQMSVERNLSFGLRVAGKKRDEIEKRVKRASEILQIEPLLKRKPAALSGGQRQRVAIGRALVRDVDVFLFDEPLSNLDAKLRTELRVELKKLHMKLGSTMIYVTHDQIEALTLADRVAVMYRGVIQQLASPKEIYQRPLNRFVAGFVGSPAMNFISGEIRVNSNPVLVTQDGVTIDLAGYKFAEPPVNGRKAVLGVRPEQIHIEEKLEAATVLPLELNLVEPMGADSLLWGNIGAESVSIRVGPDDNHHIGEKVDVYFQPTMASVFDEESGDRL